MMTRPTIPGFRDVPKTGVIYVMDRARRLGFSYTDPTWANLGQGSPETGPMAGAPPRVERLEIDPTFQKYGPVEGQRALRQRVADFYNHFYRQGHASQYTWRNVSIASGGRTALTRLAAALGHINMGHFLPDYTAYEELLSAFRSFIPIPILLKASHGYRIDPVELRDEILGRGLRAILASNPCNPTGQLVAGEELAGWVRLARESRCSFILDEFYSHYIYDGPPDEARMVSAAAYVEDVDRDPVILVDGVTKNWRYPGWRISWTVGPRQVIDAIASAGSFLDGGANNPFQHEVLPLLDPDHARQESLAIQQIFGAKRRYVLDRLAAIGIGVDAAPQGAFYVWANLAELPDAIADGMAFFEAGLAERVVTVPGHFFDVNPGRRRSSGRYGRYCRISFGPEMATLDRGLDAIERVVRSHQATIHPSVVL